MSQGLNRCPLDVRQAMPIYPSPYLSLALQSTSFLADAFVNDIRELQEILATMLFENP